VIPPTLSMTVPPYEMIVAGIAWWCCAQGSPKARSSSVNDPYGVKSPPRPWMLHGREKSCWKCACAVEWNAL